MKLKNKIKNFIFSKRTYEKDYRIYDEIIILGIKCKRKIKDLNEQFIKHFKILPDLYWYEECEKPIKKYIEQETFQEDYLNLIKGLDDKSIEIINNIINRYKIYQETKNTIFILTTDEIQQLKEINNFFPEIVNLGTKINAYKKYLLKFTAFAYDIFAKQYFIREFSNIDKEKNILDVGAYVGDSAIVLKDYTYKKLYAFEPFPESCEKMKINLELNKASNVEIVNKALSDITQNGQIIYGQGLITSLNEKHTNATSIDTITLDDWIKANPVDIGLIKVDIEGAEQNFLKGAFNTIKEQKPNMIISMYHGGDDFFHIKPLIESWDLGYTFKVRRCHPYYISNETVLICEVK